MREAGEESTEEKPAPIPIAINGNVIDPNAPALLAQGFGAGDSARSNYVLVQTAKYLTKENKEKLTELNVEVEELVSENTYLCRYEPAELDKVRNLNFVTWADEYGSKFVVSSDLKSNSNSPTTARAAAAAAAADSASQAHEVDVVFHENHKQTKDDLKAAVAKAAHVHSDTLEGRKDVIRLVLQDRYFNDVAKLDEVRAILPVVENKLYNNVARNILMGKDEIVDQANIEKSVDFKKGDFVLRGKNEIVAVADTGVDRSHDAFGNGNRIVAAQAWGRPASGTQPGSTDDRDGHGTHVSGSVLGDSTYNSPTKTFKLQGTAPEARLVMQSIGDDEGNLVGIPENVADLFKAAYDVGARVHNNSWGPRRSGLPYGGGGRQIDKFVRDNPDMVICFAGGNEGVDVDRNGVVDFKQIGVYAAAKNSITVGASESYRPGQVLKWGMFQVRGQPGVFKYQADPIKSDIVANNSSGMAAFSNRGPSREGRIKPDIVAPGTFILSARSRLVPVSENGWAQPDDPKYWYLGGTSMASPLVAGGCAVLRQALRKDLLDSGMSEQDIKESIAKGKILSAALVKALLINGAVELKGQYIPSEAGPSPNFSSGWGRVNLSESISMATFAKEPAAVGCHEGKPLDDDETYSREIDIQGSGKTLKVTLVWADLPGDHLQNDLALTAAVDGATRQGNPTNDRRNNVEQIVWANIPTGTAKVTVQVKRLTSGTQDFALVWKLY